jgi:hypothetical protein
MQDEWTGRPLVEYYIITGVGKQLVPQRSGLARTQQPTRQSSLDEAQNVSPRLRPFPQSDERFVPSVVARYPELDRPTTPFPRDCPDFCFPDGIRLVTLEEHQRDPVQPRARAQFARIASARAASSAGAASSDAQLVVCSAPVAHAGSGVVRGRLRALARVPFSGRARPLRAPCQPPGAPAHPRVPRIAARALLHRRCP